MKMKQVLATGAALSMALSMAPVTASAADKVDINVIAAQYGQQTADWWANFVTEFNEANPDINLNVEVVSWNDIYTVVNTRIANGEAPDVLNIDVFADYQAMISFFRSRTLFLKRPTARCTMHSLHSLK